MVDKDKIRKLKRGDNDDDESSDGSSKDKIKESVKKSRGSGSNSSRVKSGKANSTSKGNDDIKPLLFAIANMDMFSRTISEYGDRNISNSKAKILNSVSEDVSSEAVNFMGVFDVTDIADKYGYNWKRILNHLTHKKDIKGSKYTTKGSNPSKKDVKKLLDCVANILLYVEGNVRHLEEKDDKTKRDRVSLDVSQIVYEHYKEVISLCEVQAIAERHGYSWKDDVLKHVLENQDIQSIIDKKE